MEPAPPQLRRVRSPPAARAQGAHPAKIPLSPTPRSPVPRRTPPHPTLAVHPKTLPLRRPVARLRPRAQVRKPRGALSRTPAPWRGLRAKARSRRIGALLRTAPLVMGRGAEGYRRETARPPPALMAVIPGLHARPLPARAVALTAAMPVLQRTPPPSPPCRLELLEPGKPPWVGPQAKMEPPSRCRALGRRGLRRRRCSAKPRTTSRTSRCRRRCATSCGAISSCRSNKNGRWGSVNKSL